MFVEAVTCLALTLYHEARNHSDTELLNVAHVVINRVRDTRFPDSVCGVVLEGGEQRRYRCQFTWYCDGKPDVPYEAAQWDRVKVVSTFFIRNSATLNDPTNGALFYHAHYVQPNWPYVVTFKDNASVFYKPK